mmetsp:Transcript_11413/g.29254  ORF Transcript_11413/g.29254 Transcript_11413/m.29254 type:complete len:353 (-) Transcript_11413:290-1348(-)
MLMLEASESRNLARQSCMMPLYTCRLSPTIVTSTCSAPLLRRNLLRGGKASSWSSALGAAAPPARVRLRWWCTVRHSAMSYARITLGASCRNSETLGSACSCSRFLSSSHTCRCTALGSSAKSSGSCASCFRKVVGTGLRRLRTVSGMTRSSGMPMKAKLLSSSWLSLSAGRLPMRLSRILRAWCRMYWWLSSRAAPSWSSSCSSGLQRSGSDARFCTSVMADCGSLVLSMDATNSCPGAPTSRPSPASGSPPSAAAASAYPPASGSIPFPPPLLPLPRFAALAHAPPLPSGEAYCCPAADACSAARRADASRRSSFTTAASASGFTPFSSSPMRIDSVSLSSPVSRILEIS